VLDMIASCVERSVDTYAPEGVYPEEWDLAGLLEHAAQYYLPGHSLAPKDLEGMSRQELLSFLKERAFGAYESREAELGSQTLRELERLVVLRVVDEKWMDHLDAMDQLREGIGLRAYGQKDPLVEYKFESYEMFQNMIEAIQDDVVRYVFRVKLAKPVQAVRRVVENRGGEAAEPQRRQERIGRNDPCPCGSGKKYKKCCGRAAG